MDIVTIFAGLAVIIALLYYASGETPLSIGGYARTAGFSGFDLGIAVAIAYAESAGDPNAIGDLDLGVSVGLWQINLEAHPEYTQEQLLDPQQNANAAYAVYSAAGNSFSPWTTFRNGAYLNNSQQAQNETGVDITGTDDIGDEDEDE